MKNKYVELFELYSEIESGKVTEIFTKTVKNINAGSENVNHSDRRIDVGIESHKLYQLHLPIREWTDSQICKLSMREYDFLNFILTLPREEQLMFYNNNLTMISEFNPDDYDSKLTKKLMSLYSRMSVFCMILMCIDYLVEVEIVLESLPLPIAENLISQIGELDVSHDNK